MTDEKEPVAGRFDYEGLAGDLDAACSTETAQEAEERRNEAWSRLRDFLWKARIDFAIVGSVRSTPGELIEATRRLLLLYRLAHAQRGGTAEEHIQRRRVLEEIATATGQPGLHFRLREFMQDIGHAALASPEPVKTLDRILHSPPKRGPKKRPLRERFEIAAMVQKYRNANMSLEKACEIIAKITHPRIGSDAVRRIYENATKKEGGAALVRCVAAGVVKF